MIKGPIILGRVSKIIVTGIFRYLVFEAYFNTLSKKEKLPKLLVMTAARDASVLPLNYIARHL